MLNSVLTDIKCAVPINALPDLLEDLKNVYCTCFFCRSKNKNKGVLKECSIFDRGIQAKNSNISDKFSQVDKRNVRLSESTEINRSISEEVCSSSSSSHNHSSLRISQKLIMCPHCTKLFKYEHQGELMGYTGELDNAHKHSSCEENRINQEISPINYQHSSLHLLFSNSEDEKVYNAKVNFNEHELSIDDYINNLRYSFK